MRQNSDRRRKRGGLAPLRRWAGYIGFSFGKQATLFGRDAKSGQQVFIDIGRADSARAVVRREIYFAGHVGSYSRERAIQFPELEVLGRRYPEPGVLETSSAESSREVHQLLRFWISERTQDYSVHDGKDCRVCADA